MTLSFTIPDPLLVWLQSLGPWGWLAAAVLVFLRWRASRIVTPSTPSPNAPDERELGPLLRLLANRFPRLFTEAVKPEAVKPEGLEVTAEYRAARARLETERLATEAKLAELKECQKE